MINKENVLIFYKDSLQCEKDSLCYGKGPSTIANVYTLQKQATSTRVCGEKCRSNASLCTLQGTYVCKVIFFRSCRSLSPCLLFRTNSRPKQQLKIKSLSLSCHSLSSQSQWKAFLSCPCSLNLLCYNWKTFEILIQWFSFVAGKHCSFDTISFAFAFHGVALRIRL